MKKILQQYYQGITNQLRSEVDSVNSLFEHPGVKGTGNEDALRDLLQKFIPKRYGIGTGVVIDRNGNQSRQCDIVIYDTFLYPSFLSLTSAHLFPVDIVYATIEVKTTLTSQSAREAIENIASVRQLDYLKIEYMDSFSEGDSIGFGTRKTTAPLGFVFAYNSDTQNVETFKGWFVPSITDNTLFFPTLVGCLDVGYVSYRNENMKENVIAGEMEIGLYPQCHYYPVIRENFQKQYSIEIIEATEPDQNGRLVMYKDNLFPVKKFGKKNVYIDQGRVLLNFLVTINDLINNKKIYPSLRFMDTYMEPFDLVHLAF